MHQDMMLTRRCSWQSFCFVSLSWSRTWTTTRGQTSKWGGWSRLMEGSSTRRTRRRGRRGNGRGSLFWQRGSFKALKEALHPVSVYLHNNWSSSQMLIIKWNHFRLLTLCHIGGLWTVQNLPAHIIDSMGIPIEQNLQPFYSWKVSMLKYSTFVLHW